MSDPLFQRSGASTPSAPISSRRRRLSRLVLLLLLLGVVIWGANYVLVGQPVTSKLSEDERNASFSLSAHYRYYVIPSTLILNLRKVENASAIDLFRGLFQAAEALHQADRKFNRVLLLSEGRPVFMLKGTDFAEMGSAYANGENPVYMIRTLPEKLLSPDGTPAFSTWTGGVLGVLSKQMEDATEAGKRWANGPER